MTTEAKTIEGRARFVLGMVEEASAIPNAVLDIEAALRLLRYVVDGVPRGGDPELWKRRADTIQTFLLAGTGISVRAPSISAAHNDKPTP